MHRDDKPATRIKALYTALIIITSVVASTVMGQWTGIRGLAYVDTREPSQIRLGAMARQVGFVPVDVRDVSSFNALRAASAPNPPKTPTLVITSTKPPRIVVGSVPSSNLLTNVTAPKDELKRGRSSLLVICLLILLVGLNAKSLVALAPLVGPIGLLLAAVLPGHCALCDTGTPLVESFALPFASLLFLTSTVLVTFGVFTGVRSMGILTALFGLVPIGQIYLQLVDPRFCPLCLTICLFSAVQFFIGVDSINAGTLRTFAFPKVSYAASFVIFPLCLFKIWSALWITPATKVTSTPLENIVGTLAKSRLPGYDSSGGAKLLMVSVPGCHACGDARTSFSRQGLNYVEISPCSALRKGGCFDTRGEGFYTPLLLVVSPLGQIEYQHSGWPTSSAEQIRLCSDLSELISH